MSLLFFVSDRARVTKGLPDVVAIMEGKVGRRQGNGTTLHHFVWQQAEQSHRSFPVFFTAPRPPFKSLCLTCFVDGEPAPEVTWLRNDKEIAKHTQFDITKEPRCSTITINNVTMANSGKYSISVRNQFGAETVDVTVSVYKHGEEPPPCAVEMGFYA